MYKDFVSADFSRWLDNALHQEIPEEVAAFGFNLYEDDDDHWSVELVGTDRFDPEDEDWMCYEVTDFGTRDNCYTWHEDTTWMEIQKKVIAFLMEYLENGKSADVLQSKQAVGVGFVDGDVEMIWEKGE